MASGKFRDRATVESPDHTSDDYGNVTSGWQNAREIWADVLERTGKEKLEAGAVQSMRMATVRVRSNNTTRAITTADRLTVRGEVWNIRSIAQIGRSKRVIEFSCEAGVAV